MEQIDKELVQKELDRFAKRNVYVHLETTNGVYAAHFDQNAFPSGVYIRNALVKFQHGKITGNGPFRVGLKMDFGWVYAEGVTHFDSDEKGRLLLAGHDFNGKLAVALQLSATPF